MKGKDPDFDYFALRALMLWVRAERDLLKSFRRAPTSDAIRQSLKHFMISRNFKGIGSDPTVAKSIARLLEKVSAKQRYTPDEAVEKVLLLEKRFVTKFKRSNLSAASKLLWLKHRTPFIIYDKRAVDALPIDVDALPIEKDKRNYPAYCRRWRLEFGKVQGEIESAAKRLLKLQGYFSSCLSSKIKLKTVVNRPWFHERIFDVYLWEKGGVKL